MNPMRRALEDLDLPALRAIWGNIAPHLPQPKDDAEALATAHYARTEARSIGFRARAWSHRWLTDRGLPSGLPDNLRAPAERAYPVVVKSVGVAVMAGSERTRPVAMLVRDAMSDAVSECYADGHCDDPDRIRARMGEAKAGALRSLLGLRA